MKMYAIFYKNGSKETRTEEIGTARLDEGRISERKYNELKRAAMKLAKSGERISITTEDGRKDTFGGYPAFTYVRFE